MTYRKKLIEVALPLEAINKESSREKSIRHGHPSTLHTWWARRPLAACRAVLFASIVNDPSSLPDEFPTEEAQERERQRLFRILQELVKWENTTNEAVLEVARAEIRKATGGNPPPVLDPFCGGGSIPLEAQRLGLEAHASDLNPVAVLITKALIEIPPRFSGQSPVNPDSQSKLDQGRTYKGAEGLAEDVRYYGQWMRDEAHKRIGHLYPKVKLPADKGGGEATVIAWLWARAVKCPNPTCGAQMPLVRSFWLSTKPMRKTWVEPVVDKQAKTVRFEVREGDGAPDGTMNRKGGRCIVCESPVPFSHIREEGRAGRMDARLMAIVGEGTRGRTYVSPSPQQKSEAPAPSPSWEPPGRLPDNPRDFKTPNYGMDTFASLFTDRQLVTLTTFSDLVEEARELVLKDAIAASLADDGERLDTGGSGAASYADALATYLAISVSKTTTFHNSLARWRAGENKSAPAFGRQALPMVWDYAEVNPFAGAGGDWLGVIDGTAKVVARTPFNPAGVVRQLDATSAVNGVRLPLVCTDPPYYDNIGYADLSDFFYAWLRRNLSALHPTLFSTLLSPKDEELVATPYRFGGDKKKAEIFFEEGLGRAFLRMEEAHHPDYPLTLFYAFKQAEVREGDMASALVSTGWETMLEGLLEAGFTITGTWPMRTEMSTRQIGMSTNALASSVVLVCRRRPEGASIATRTEFLNALRAELPGGLRNLQHGNVAPVDLAQASIGPGMAVFSRYAKVIESDGSPMRVGTALGLINQVLDEVLAEQEGQFDPATRWAIAWFEQHGMNEGPYGDAENLSRAKNTSVQGLVQDGFLWAKGGKVRLLRRDELAADWDPASDHRLTKWEITQHLIRAHSEGGDAATAALARKVGGAAEEARDLAYRLFQICDRKGWAQEAIAYNALVVAWPEIARLAAAAPGEVQETLLEE